MTCCIILAIIDLEVYNFGLYIVLLCIVGTMIACALCIANPNACPNPKWYTNFCLLMEEMYPVPHNNDMESPKMSGLRKQMLAHYGGSITTNIHSNTGIGSGEESKTGTRFENKGTVAMLAPAVHIMHQVWRGMAWVTDAVEEEEDNRTQSYCTIEHGGSFSSRTNSDVGLQCKKLSTIVESTCGSFVIEQDETSDCTSKYDEIL
ncbi:Hypothetical protein SRAE_2000135700 [Strongyloides ratti]|uniref:Uncharacterized protein n=1 Tax=Strongyloides ratti TaxID=34506 RepID=A0A090LGV8_STRRB|nr:Hypothetical protein SRAE_2000135700 [Strongyloides ratti]CEF66690.1 Hypothetical protein SRAE_2000135700 [Strongyloides ratti]